MCIRDRHILAMAVQELFPGTQVIIGPVIDNGFYYDFARKESFTQEDLKKIEIKMKEIFWRLVSNPVAGNNNSVRIFHNYERKSKSRCRIVKKPP